MGLGERHITLVDVGEGVGQELQSAAICCDPWVSCRWFTAVGNPVLRKNSIVLPNNINGVDTKFRMCMHFDL